MRDLKGTLELLVLPNAFLFGLHGGLRLWKNLGLIVADRCCVLSAEADGQQEEEVGVAVWEEVTFVNMSRDNANSVDALEPSKRENEKVFSKRRAGL